jgi:DNA-directed RNA polymerase specialized sigma24 family protein
MLHRMVSRLEEEAPRGRPERVLQDSTSFPEQIAAEERDWVERVRAGDKDAEERLIRANLPHIDRAVKQYVPAKDPRFDDLFQEGSLGLCDAIKSFDSNREKRLWGFAAYHVHGRIKRALKGEGRIRGMAGPARPPGTDTDGDSHDSGPWEDRIEAAQIDLYRGEVVPLPSPADLWRRRTSHR